MQHWKLFSTSALVALAVGAPAFAQKGPTTAAASASAATIEELIVTAQKRQENVQDVPISVTVVSAEQLARRGVQTVQDLSQASAGLEFTSTQSAPGGGAFVRGIGTESLGAATAQSSVSVVLDGVVLGNANINDIFDVERVEVLKGPQGTLFGSSVSAGVISITTRAPNTSQYSAFMSAEYADSGLGSGYNRWAVRTAVNLPINENSAVRVAAYGYDVNAFTHNVFTGQDGDKINYGFRLRYLNHLTDKLTFNLIADYSKSHDVDDPYLLYDTAPAGSPLDQALRKCGVVASPTNVDNCDGLPFTVKNTIEGISGQFDYAFGNLTATSITSYRKTRLDSINDIITIPPAITQQVFGSQCHFTNCAPIVSLTSGGGAAGSTPQTTNRDLFTQEVRLASPASGRLEWVVGAYYQQANYHMFQPVTLTVNVAGGAPAGNLVLSQTEVKNAALAKDYAVFGNLNYHLTDSTRLILGARYTYSEVGEKVSNRTIQSPFNPAAIGTLFADVSTNASAFTWRAGVQHDFSPETMAYFLVSTGFKAPQINDSITSGPVFAIKAERPTSFELGVKQTLLGQRFYVNADLFYTKVDDFQSQSCIPSTTQGVACSNINVPEVTTKGVELEVFGRPFQGNSLNISAAYTDATYPSNFFGADGTLMTGQQLNYAPKFKASLSTEQEFHVADGYALVIGGDLTYRTKQSMYLSALPQYVVGAETLGNIRLGVRADKGWAAYFFVRNLGDAVYPTQLFPTQAFHPGGLWHLLDPNSRRVVGFQMQASF